jgi:hypothetical protein
MLRLNEPTHFPLRYCRIHLTPRYCATILHFFFILIGGKALANAGVKL